MHYDLVTTMGSICPSNFIPTMHVGPVSIPHVPTGNSL